MNLERELLTMDSETRSKIREEIKDSTIPEELKVCYLMAEATSIMSARSFERIKSVFRRHGFETKENTLLTGIVEYCKLVQRAEGEFFRRIDPQIQGATFDRPGGDIEIYDRFSEDANEICRLVMLYVDRRSMNNEAFSKVFSLLRKLPEGGLIADEDIARYKQK